MLETWFQSLGCEGNSYPLQYSGLENFKDRGAWQVTVNGAAESDATEQLTLSNRNISRYKNIIYKELKINSSHNYFAVHNFLLISVKKKHHWTSPMAQWLGLCVSTAGVGVGFLLRECHVAQPK